MSFHILHEYALGYKKIDKGMVAIPMFPDIFWARKKVSPKYSPTSFQNIAIFQIYRWKIEMNVNSRSRSWCIKWRHMKFFYCLISWGRSRGVENINMKFCWDASQLSWARLSQKTEKYQKLPKLVGLVPSIRILTKSLLQSQFVVKKAPLTFGSSKHIANELIARKLWWIESSCLYQNTSISYTYTVSYTHLTLPTNREV